MWRTYGDFEAGVMVQTTVGRLRGSFGSETGFLASMRYVDFNNLKNGGLTNEHPTKKAKAFLSKAFLRPYLFKDIGFRSEQEVRLILPAKTAGAGRAVPVDWNSLTTRIVCGPKWRSDEIESLQKLLTQVHPEFTPEIVPSRLSPNKDDFESSGMRERFLAENAVFEIQAPDDLSTLESEDHI